MHVFVSYPPSHSLQHHPKHTDKDNYFIFLDFQETTTHSTRCLYPFVLTEDSMACQVRHAVLQKWTKFYKNYKEGLEETTCPSYCLFQLLHFPSLLFWFFVHACHFLLPALECAVATIFHWAERQPMSKQTISVCPLPKHLAAQHRFHFTLQVIVILKHSTLPSVP